MMTYSFKRPSGHRLQEGCALFFQKLGALTLWQAHKNVVGEDAAEHLSADKGRNVAKHGPYFYSGVVGKDGLEEGLGGLISPRHLNLYHPG